MVGTDARKFLRRVVQVEMRRRLMLCRAHGRGTQAKAAAPLHPAWRLLVHERAFQFCKSLTGYLLTRTLAPVLLVSIVLMKTPPRYYTRGGF